MLAPGEDPLSYSDYFKKLRYPLLCSPKLDGIRCLVKDNMCLSRSGKILPSYQVQDEFSNLEHFDGELIEGLANDFDVYNRTQSYVMSEDKPGDIYYHVFDYTHPDWLNKPFYERLEFVDEAVMLSNFPNLYVVKHHEVETYEDLLEYEDKCLNAGYEGIMMRDPVGRYKNGRGTFREGLIYKLKRFQDDEAYIVGLQEQLTNNNTLEVDELGYAKRSYSKQGLVPAGTLGNFQVLWNGLHLDVAPGSFNHAQRQKIWNNPGEYIGKLLKFRYFSHGVKDKPRFPRATGIRHQIDL